MSHPSRSLKQLAARRAELVAESEAIRDEMRRKAAALLPVIDTVETALKIGGALKTAASLTRNARGICSLFVANGG